MQNLSQNIEYQDFITEVKARIRKAQYEAMKKVNQEHIALNWDLGKMIVQKQSEKGWGKAVVEQIAKDLQAEFIGIKGFSSRNLWRMRQFYETYHQSIILPPLVAEIGWTHNVVIMEKCKDDLQREFYILMTKKFGWTKDVLIHQIENNSYQKYLNSQHNFDTTLPEKYQQQAILALKDEYQFDFLELADQHSEFELEQKIVQNIRRFLTEMGGYFTFIANQYRVEIDDKEYFIDLLLFHRKLRCLVAIDLKIGEFTPEMAGKMQFYLNILNDKVRETDENPSIGIIICKSKNRTIVEYALKDSSKPIGVASYTIGTELPKEWQAFLPSPEQLEKHFLLIENLKS
jgi:predicted nuclease of restriction endonuclease-like (RecB) superfamily